MREWRAPLGAAARASALAWNIHAVPRPPKQKSVVKLCTAA
jgi:hypothetical protein